MSTEVAISAAADSATYVDCGGVHLVAPYSLGSGYPCWWFATILIQRRHRYAWIAYSSKRAQRVVCRWHNAQIRPSSSSTFTLFIKPSFKKIPSTLNSVTGRRMKSNKRGYLVSCMRRDGAPGRRGAWRRSGARVWVQCLRLRSFWGF